MKRLIEAGLMFGNLVEVSAPALVERYNRALEMLTGKRTALADFHIDISGYSPEIGDALGDDLYLNPNGCNRQFILLTTAQKSAPLLNVKFSTSRTILRRFIDENEAQLFALTARDAMAGELQNSVYEVSTPARLFDIRRVTVEADTVGGAVADAARLGGLIDRFRTEPDGWRDDLLIADMIGLAKKTGDVTRAPVALSHMAFEQGNFWTAHFGGLYIFREAKLPGVIAVGDKAALGALPIAPVMGLADRNAIADWLERNGLVEPIVQARGADAAAILRQKMDFVLVEAAEQLKVDLGAMTRRDLHQLARQLGPALPDEFKGLAALLRWVEGGGDWPHITSAHPAYFYTLRARNHPDRDLVNMALAELAPMDIRQLFICHKALFYRLYSGWSEAKRGYVVDFLTREYQVDKAGARAALFGPEPGMDEAERPAPHATRDLVNLVGPWGAVRRNE